VFDFTTEPDVPAVSFTDHRHVLKLAFYRARVAEFDQPDFWQANITPLGIKSPHIALASLKAKTVAFAFLAWFWIGGTSGEEIAEGRIEIAQELLLAGLTYSRNPVELCSQRRQFAGLGYVIQTLASCALKLTVAIAALLKSQIVDQTAHAGELPKKAFLFFSWLELAGKCRYSQRKAPRLCASRTFGLCYQISPRCAVCARNPRPCQNL
jgi:hypothetical protein